MGITNIEQVTIGIAVLAGMASFLSPCVLALVPAYVGYLSGRSMSYADGGGNVKANRWITFSHGVAFVIGFAIIFILLGVATGALSEVLRGSVTQWLTRIGGIFVVVFGLHMLGIIHIPFLEYDLRSKTVPDRSGGYVSSAMMGVFFSAGWAPCVGPVLGLIYTFAINGGSTSLGVQLFAAYSLGLGIPFLLASLGIDWVVDILQNHGKVMVIASKSMAVVMIVIGVLLFFGLYESMLAPLSGIYVDFGL